MCIWRLPGAGPSGRLFLLRHLPVLARPGKVGGGFATDSPRFGRRTLVGRRHLHSTSEPSELAVADPFRSPAKWWQQRTFQTRLPLAANRRRSEGSSWPSRWQAPLRLAETRLFLCSGCGPCGPDSCAPRVASVHWVFTRRVLSCDFVAVVCAQLCQTGPSALLSHGQPHRRPARSGGAPGANHWSLMMPHANPLPASVCGAGAAAPGFSPPPQTADAGGCRRRLANAVSRAACAGFFLP